MSISLVSNTYLEETSSKFRSKPVPWEGYQRAGLVTSEDLTLIKRIGNNKARNESILLSDGQTYALLYLRLLKKLQRIDTMQCLLVLIAEALTDHEERIPLFFRT
ncbi:Armadillo-like helical, partial [Pleurotus pulmonarius]